MDCITTKQDKHNEKVTKAHCDGWIDGQKPRVG